MYSTHYLRLCGVRHMVKDHSDGERGNPLLPNGLLFLISSKGSFYIHHRTDRIAHTTAFVTPVVVHWLEREIAQWVHPMKGRSVVGTEKCTLFRVYIGGHTCIFKNCVSLLLLLAEIYFMSFNRFV